MAEQHLSGPYKYGTVPITEKKRFFMEYPEEGSGEFVNFWFGTGDFTVPSRLNNQYLALVDKTWAAQIKSAAEGFLQEVELLEGE